MFTLPRCSKRYFKSSSTEKQMFKKREKNVRVWKIMPVKRFSDWSARKKTGKQYSSKLCQSNNYLKGAKDPQSGGQHRGPGQAGCPALVPPSYLTPAVAQRTTARLEAVSRFTRLFWSEPPLPSLKAMVGVQTHSHFRSFWRSSSKTRYRPNGWLWGQSPEQAAPLRLGFYLLTLQDTTAGGKGNPA